MVIKKSTVLQSHVYLVPTPSPPFSPLFLKSVYEYTTHKHHTDILTANQNLTFF